MSNPITSTAIPRRLRILPCVFAACAVLAFAAAFVPAVASAAFGVASFDGTVTDASGVAFAQAGGHPYAMTTQIEFNHHAEALKPFPFGPPFTFEVPDADTKDVAVDLPPGLVGNPAGLGECTSAELAGAGGQGGPTCPVSSIVGTVFLKSTYADLGGHPDQGLPIYNMRRPAGHPALFAFQVHGDDVFFIPHVRSGGDYGLSIDTADIPAALQTRQVTVTFWGVPADPSHDFQRCNVSFSDPYDDATRGCPAERGNVSFGPNAAGIPPTALLTLPTRCTPVGVGLPVTMRTDSWENPGSFVEASFSTHLAPNFPEAGWPGAQQGTTGCDRVPFEPSISVTPTTQTADSPTGLHLDLSLPQEGLSNPDGIATADLKRAVVTFPAGMAVNPAAAGGLGACTLAQANLASEGPANCPDSAKIGTVTIETPLLPEPLQGAVYLGAQGDNPFGTLLSLYIVASDRGVNVKLAGRVDTDPTTGQLTATFDNQPQLPFSELKLDLFGGPRAALTTPAGCGTFTTTSSFSPWSAADPNNPTPAETATRESSFDINSGCVSGFSPTLLAGTVNPGAGGFSPLVVSFSRSDLDQPFGTVTVHLPPGLDGKLAGVPRCGEPQAAQGACPTASQIGHVTVAAGSGPNPVYLPEAGRPQDSVYLTGPYKGSPFGLSIVVPAEAGPFNLGTVVTRAAIDVDPHTSQSTITSDPLPRILQGIPLQIKTINVIVDREGFTFNPTNCNPLSVNAVLGSSEGLSASPTSRFQAGECASLKFHPTFTATTRANGHVAQNGESLDVKITAPGQGPEAPFGLREAAIAKVETQLPAALPSRLETLQRACTEVQFAANPAGCPPESRVGTAVAHTPVLAAALEGPAYLVSHGGAAFPDLVLVLQGEGVTLEVVGHTQIRKLGTHEVTFSKFETVPDAPVSSFELHLPEGPFSVLALAQPACGRTVVRHGKRVHVPTNLIMPTKITGQNGAVEELRTKVAVTGCPKQAGAHHAKRHRRRGQHRH